MNMPSQSAIIWPGEWIDGLDGAATRRTKASQKGQAA